MTLNKKFVVQHFQFAAASLHRSNLVKGTSNHCANAFPRKGLSFQKSHKVLST